MNNAAIVIFRRSALPRILKFFAMPGIANVIDIGITDRTVRVHIIECPVMGTPADNRKVLSSLRSLCLENDISFFIGKNTEYYFGSGLEHMESIMERSGTDRVKAIKALAALVKLSGERNADLLKKNMCFIGESISYRYISTMSEEASGVFIYEHEKMVGSLKKEVFERLMEEQGVSAVFTKDMHRAISQSDIIIADAGVMLEDFQAELSGKILIGENPAEGGFQKVGRVLLWYESLAGLTEDNALIRLNDEMLEILRHFYREKGLLAFLKRFPHIYISK